MNIDHTDNEHFIQEKDIYIFLQISIRDDGCEFGARVAEKTKSKYDRYPVIIFLMRIYIGMLCLKLQQKYKFQNCFIIFLETSIRILGILYYYNII